MRTPFRIAITVLIVFIGITSSVPLTSHHPGHQALSPRVLGLGRVSKFLGNCIEELARLIDGWIYKLRRRPSAVQQTPERTYPVSFDEDYERWKQSMKHGDNKQGLQAGNRGPAMGVSENLNQVANWPRDLVHKVGGAEAANEKLIDLTGFRRIDDAPSV
ncbi:hypothetical protein FRC03_001448 [Tulasnella sp. 419]|nr:hypothetical protein FRC03_001448 [Tulasnella sp. 419]